MTNRCPLLYMVVCKDTFKISFKKNYMQQQMMAGVSTKDLQKARQIAKRKRTSVACTRCKSSKTRCSEFRPCSKCKRSGAADSCSDDGSVVRDIAEISASDPSSPSVVPSRDGGVYVKQETSASCPYTITEQLGSTHYSSQSAQSQSTCISSANISVDQHMPGFGSKAFAGATFGPFGRSLYQSSNWDSQFAAPTPEMSEFYVPPQQPHIGHMARGEAMEEMLRRGLQPDLLRAQAFQTASSPLSHQLTNIPHAPFLQPSWPPPSTPPTPDFLPNAISALLRGAQGAGPAPQPDALRLILALAAATAAGPLAGPPRF